MAVYTDLIFIVVCKEPYKNKSKTYDTNKETTEKMTDAIIGAIIAALMGALVILHVHRKSTISIPIKEFTDVFGELIQCLKYNKPFRMKEIIKHHERAVIDLRTSLNCWEVWRFNRHWKKYHKQASDYDNSLKQFGRDKANQEMLDAIDKLIKKVKRL